MLNAAAQPPVPFVQKKFLSPATLVVARYKEDLTWLLEIDENLRVVVYNKGRKIHDKRILERINVLEQLPNVGRESDTYLAYLESGRTQGDGEWTIFTQGDPFVHSPHFLDLLRTREYWHPVQPLTACYDDAKAVPPQIIVELERREWIGDLRVRTELFSLFNCVNTGKL